MNRHKNESRDRSNLLLAVAFIIVLVVVALFVFRFLVSDREPLLEPATSPPTYIPTRELPDSYEAGTPFVATINVTIDSNVSAYAVEDSIPSGWNVDQISDGGVFTSGKVRWVSYPAVSKTLSYRALPSSDSSGDKSFSGVVSYDGVSVNMGGDTSIDGPSAPDNSGSSGGSSGGSSSGGGGTSGGATGGTGSQVPPSTGVGETGNVDAGAEESQAETSEEQTQQSRAKLVVGIFIGVAVLALIVVVLVVMHGARVTRARKNLASNARIVPSTADFMKDLKSDERKI